MNLMVISSLHISKKEWITTSERDESCPVFQGETPQPWRVLGQTQVESGDCWENEYTGIFLVKGSTIVPRTSLGEFLFEKLSAIKKDMFDKHGLAETSDRRWGLDTFAGCFRLCCSKLIRQEQLFQKQSFTLFATSHETSFFWKSVLPVQLNVDKPKVRPALVLLPPISSPPQHVPRDMVGPERGHGALSDWSL